ncbi:DUF1513 domain-containing protein [Desertibaculum subflavum]|uniref:DUF1513 domain-containing protein n=1 Tax=Desertibaculum subflavum TaxID=2268458 RepID=UPI000E673529
MTFRIDRREALLGLLGVAMAPHVARAAAAAPQRVIGARADTGSRYFVTGFDTAGDVAFDLPLPGRGHGFAVRRDGGEAVAFSRRPGDRITVLDPRAGRMVREVAAATDRWFNGHGTYGPSGRVLYASETIASSGDGVIGVYDAGAGFRRVGEFPSGGLDPHDMRLLPGGETIVVANGGILTHPDAPGFQLNLHDMQPSLAYLDAGSGALRQKATLPPALHQLGTRHLAVAPDGTVAVAMQFAGPSMRTVPLVATHRLGAPEMTFLPLTEDLLAGLRGYCGSAAMDATGTVLGIASPRGNLAVFWDLATGHVLGKVGVADGCGIAADGEDGFLLGSGLGGMFRYQPGAADATRLPLALATTARWDNHLMTLPATG